MAHSTFVDTSGFYALLVGGDDRHERAVRWMHEARSRLRAFVTTDYVLDETATLLRARGYGHLSRTLLTTMTATQACRIEWTDAERFRQVSQFFLKHHDHAWSFTDCLSFCVMKDLRIRQALTKDGDFQTAGFQAILCEE